MKRLLYIFLFGVLLVGCKPDPKPTPKPTVSEHVLILYFPGRGSGLESYLQMNADNALASITENFPSDCKIVYVQDDRFESKTTYLKELIPPRKGKAASWKTLITYEESNSAAKEDMQLILNDIKRLVPSQHYGMILGSHGTGWIPKELTVDKEHQHAPSVEGGYRPAFGHDLSWLFDTENPMTRSFGPTNTNTMSMSDMVTGLSPIHFDYILFDACFMASVELLYELRSSANYVIASPIEIMAAGFPYKDITPMFFDNSKTLEQRLRNVSDYFVEYYETADISAVKRRSAVISLVKLSEMEAFAQSVGEIYRYAQENDVVVDAENVRGLEGMPTHVFFDLNDYLRQLTATAPLDLYLQYIEQYGRTVIFHDNTDTFFSAYPRYEGSTQSAQGLCGLCTYVTRPQYEDFAAAWNSTEWGKIMTAD